jgi:hypothetical protein
VEAALQTAVHACELFVSEGIEAAMNQMNRQENAGSELGPAGRREGS